MQNLAKRSFDLITHSIFGSMWLKLASVIRNTTGIHLPFFSSMFQSMCSVLAMCLQGGGSFQELCGDTPFLHASYLLRVL